MPAWLNHAAIAAPSNGTTSHTASPASGTVVTGSTFTPTAGRFLMCVVEGAVTSTTPSGWSLPTNGSAINNTGLYVWTKTAAGGDSVTTTHNGSNYPVLFDFYEYASGTAFVKAATAVSVSSAATGPSITGLTGTNTLMAAGGAAAFSGAAGGTTSWASGTQATSAVGTNSGSADGYIYGLAYVDGSTATSFSDAFTYSVASGSVSANTERLVWALNVPSSSANAGTIAATLPSTTGTLSGTSTDPGTVSGHTPAITGAVPGQSTNPGVTDADLPASTGTITGSSTNPGTLDAATPATAGSLTGTQTNAGTLATQTPLTQGQIADETRDPGTLDATLPETTGSITGTSTNPGAAGGALPATTGTVSETATNTGSLDGALSLVQGQIREAVPRIDITIGDLVEHPTHTVDATERPTHEVGTIAEHPTYTLGPIIDRSDSMELDRAAARWYRVEIPVTDNATGEPVADLEWTACFGGTTWVDGEAVPGQPGWWRWFVAGPEAGATEGTVISSSVVPRVRTSIAPEKFVEAAPRIRLVN